MPTLAKFKLIALIRALNQRERRSVATGLKIFNQVVFDFGPSARYYRAFQFFLHLMMKRFLYAALLCLAKLGDLTIVKMRPDRRLELLHIILTKAQTLETESLKAQ